jgi:hypothetical protein
LEDLITGVMTLSGAFGIMLSMRENGQDGMLDDARYIFM